MLESVDLRLGPKRLQVPAESGHDDALMSAGALLQPWSARPLSS